MPADQAPDCVRHRVRWKVPQGYQQFEAPPGQSWGRTSLSTRADPVLRFSALTPESTPGRPPVPDRDLCFIPATELHRLYRSRRTAPPEVMGAVLARVHAVNPGLNAIVTLERESAMKAARAATAA